MKPNDFKIIFDSDTHEVDIETLIGCPIDIVSTGPDRAETIVIRHPFSA